MFVSMGKRSHESIILVLYCMQLELFKFLEDVLCLIQEASPVN